MISPWTIYKDQKDSSPNPSNPKKTKHDNIKNNKKSPKFPQNKFPSSTQSHQPTNTHENQLQTLHNQNIPNSQYQNQCQDKQYHNPNINNPQQNKNQSIRSEICPQKYHDIDETDELFKGLDNPQLITDLDKSKDFLKNIVSDSLTGHLDNSKLLQFCKNQSNSDILKNQSLSPKKLKSITNLMRIEASKHALLQEWNAIILLKYVKLSLRNEEEIERQVNNNIELVMQKLTQELLPRVSPQELLLQKLLRNQQQKMAKNKQSKTNTKQSASKGNHDIDKTFEPVNDKSVKKPKKQRQLSNEQIMQNLKQDIEKSSIIKYLNSSQSPYLQKEQSKKRGEKNYHGSSFKSKDLLNSIQIHVNNTKLTEKLIYVSKKPVTSRPNFQNPQKEYYDHDYSTKSGDTPLNNVLINSEHQLNQKFLKKQQKDNIEKLIKQHMAIRQSKKQPKFSQIEQGVQKIEVEVRKLQGKNYIVLQNSSSNSPQSNLISPKINKSRTIDLINHNPIQKNENKKQSKLNLQSPLIPPQFELPQLSHRTLELDKKKMSSSGKLLQLITNNILQQKHKQAKRNSTEDQKRGNNLIDQLFIKDKEKKQMIMRRDHTVNVNNTKEILREVNKKKLLNFDEQIMSLKQAQKSINSINKQNQANSTQENQSTNPKPLQVMNAMKKDFLKNNSIDEDYNFMRKRQSKLTPLETELIGLIQSQHNLESKDLEQTKKPKVSIQMNASGLKFSDHQIAYEMNLRMNGKINSD